LEPLAQASRGRPRRERNPDTGRATNCWRCGVSTWPPTIHPTNGSRVEAWARYVQDHPYAPRMYFTETTGGPEIRAMHDEATAPARAALRAIFGAQPGAERVAGADRLAFEMAAEVVRGGLTALAKPSSGRP
jgi:hypothetical protein